MTSGGESMVAKWTQVESNARRIAVAHDDYGRPRLIWPSHPAVCGDGAAVGGL